MNRVNHCDDKSLITAVTTNSCTRQIHDYVPVVNCCHIGNTVWKSDHSLLPHDRKAIDHCQVKGEEKDVIIPFHLGCRIMTAQGHPSLTWTFCDHLVIFGTGPTRLTSFCSDIGKQHTVAGVSMIFFERFSVFIVRNKTVRECN